MLASLVSHGGGQSSASEQDRPCGMVVGGFGGGSPVVTYSYQQSVLKEEVTLEHMVAPLVDELPAVLTAGLHGGVNWLRASMNEQANTCYGLYCTLARLHWW